MKKFLIIMAGMLVAFTSCKDDTNNELENEYEVAERELYKSYPNAENIVWATKHGLQIANFYNPSNIKSSTERNYTVWYAVNNDKATEKKSSESSNNLNILPEKVLATFKETEYADTKLWIIDEIEKDIEYRSGQTEPIVIYEIELDGVGINLHKEVEIDFDSEGNILFIEEDIDNDDKDDIIITPEMEAKVKEYVIKMEYAQNENDIMIVSSEMDDNLIEVDVAIFNNPEIKEVELFLNPNTYEVVENQGEVKYNYTFANLPNEYKDPIINWYSTIGSNYPIPAEENIYVEVSIEFEGSIKYADVEFDYNNYEAEFELKYDASNKVYIIEEAEVELED